MEKKVSYAISRNKLIVELIERDDDKVSDYMPLLRVLKSENKFKVQLVVNDIA